MATTSHHVGEKDLSRTTSGESRHSGEEARPAPCLVEEAKSHDSAVQDKVSSNDDSSIRYEYLTFDTEVCFLGDDTVHDSNTDISPPNLNKFQSPFRWSTARKTFCTAISCAITFSSGYSAGSYSPCATALREKWQLSGVAYNVGITTWAVGFACSPMFLAPLSEINGRRPVFLGSAAMLFFSILGCAVTESYAGMLVARFFVGAGASTFATMVGGVISDVYHAEDRNAPMALYSASALFGTPMGPLVSSFVVTRAGWRWVFWHQIIFLVFTISLVIFFFKETRGSVLLSRKAAAINKYYENLEQQGISTYLGPNRTLSTGGQLTNGTCDPKGQPSPIDEKYSKQTPSPTLDPRPANPDQSCTITSDLIPSSTQPKPPAQTPHQAQKLRYKVASDENRSSLSRLLYLSLTTPFKLLSTEPVVFFFSLWVSFAWALLYMTFSVLPLVFSTRHNFTIEQNGLVFASIGTGTILGSILSIYQERLARRKFPKLNSSPEGRLYFACLESAFLPIGLFWFGWTTFESIHWIVPCIAMTVAQIGIFSIYLAVFNYLADVYHRYASSAIAAQSFCRNMLAAIFPLFTDVMFVKMGYPEASSVLGAVAAILTLVPWVLVFFGEKIRRRSPIAREIMVEE